MFNTTSVIGMNKIYMYTNERERERERERKRERKRESEREGMFDRHPVTGK